MHAKRNLVERVLATPRFIGYVVLVIAMFHITVSALWRAAFNAPFEGTLEQVGNWYMPLIVYTGMVLAQQQREHIEARIIFDRLTPRVQLEWQLIGYLIVIAVSALVAVHSWEAAIHAMEIGKTAGVTGVVIWWTYFVVPISMALLVVQVVIDIWRLIKTKEIPTNEEIDILEGGTVG